MFRHENSIGIDHDDELMTMNFEQSHRKIVQHVFIQNLKIFCMCQLICLMFNIY
jgi:hypothetical protein